MELSRFGTFGMLVSFDYLVTDGEGLKLVSSFLETPLRLLECMKIRVEVVYPPLLHSDVILSVKCSQRYCHPSQSRGAYNLRSRR